MSEHPVMEQAIADILRKTLSIEVSSPDTDLFEEGLMDSLTLVQLLLALDQEMGIAPDLENLELDHFRTIAKIAEFAVARAKAV